MDCIQSVSLAANYYVTCDNWQHISDSSLLSDIPHVGYSYFTHGGRFPTTGALPQLARTIRERVPRCPLARIWIMISKKNNVSACLCEISILLYPKGFSLPSHSSRISRKSPSRRAVSSHSTPTPGIFSRLSMGSVPLLILSNLCFAETFTFCNLSLALSLAQAHTPRQGLQKTCGKIRGARPRTRKIIRA